MCRIRKDRDEASSIERSPAAVAAGGAGDKALPRVEAASKHARKACHYRAKGKEQADKQYLHSPIIAMTTPRISGAFREGAEERLARRANGYAAAERGRHLA